MGHCISCRCVEFSDSETANKADKRNKKSKRKYSKASRNDADNYGMTEIKTITKTQNIASADNAGNDETSKLKETSNNSQVSVSNEEIDLQLIQLKNEYKRDITQCFWLFAGHAPYAKTNLYMSKNDLEVFLHIMDIFDPVNEVFAAIDSEITNGQIEITEFVGYFCDITVNPKCNELRDEIIGSTNWILVKKSLKIFEIIDKDRNGEITFDEFIPFCEKLGILEESQIMSLWNEIDKDGSSSINIKELIEWFTERLARRGQENYRRSTITAPKIEPKDQNINGNKSTVL